jgi:hypothetical protein
LAIRNISISGEPVHYGYDYRYAVKIDSLEIPLTAKSFKFFVIIAWHRVHSAGGWVHRETLEPGTNQSRYIYRMKNEIKAGAICRAVNPKTGDSHMHSLINITDLIENDRQGNYRLNVEAAAIEFHAGNLGCHPDFAVSSLFETAKEKQCKS